MANYPQIEIGPTPKNIFDGIAAGTEVIFQNTDGDDVLLVESANATDGGPNVLRGSRWKDSASYTVGSDPLWAWTAGGRATLTPTY